MSAAVITKRLIEEGINARAHFQVWWALRSSALPRFHRTMKAIDHVAFFQVASSGHYVLFLLALTKIFDRDERVAGISELKKALRAEGRKTTALKIARKLKPHESVIKAVMNIRNRSLVHNEFAIARRRVYKLNGVTPNQLRALIEAVCSSIRVAALDLGLSETIFDSDRFERATMSMLESLEKGLA